MYSLEVNLNLPRLMTGGRCHFLPKTNPQSSRMDDKDLIAHAIGEGYNYIPDRDTFDGFGQEAALTPRILGLFHPGVYLYFDSNVAYVLHHRSCSN
jgi:alkaline phosphatase